MSKKTTQPKQPDQTQMARWFVRNDGVMFISIDDVIKDLRQGIDAGLNDVEMVMVALETMRELARATYIQIPLDERGKSQGLSDELQQKPIK